MKWIPDNIEIKINSQELPTATLISLDLEYDETATQLVCAGVFDGTSYYFYSDISELFLSYLRSTNWVCVDGIHAELKVLNKLYGGFSAKQIQFDVKIMGYVFDSAAKDWGLKNLAKRYLNVEWPKYQELKKEYKFKSIAKLPQEVLVDYNGSDCVFTYRLWQYFSKHFTAQQWDFYNKIELPTNHLLAEVEAKGIKISTAEVRRIHNENSKKRRQTKKLLFSQAGKEFNPNSPKQVLPLLHENGARTRTTGEDEIKRFKHLPFIQSLLEYRGLQKLCSTYTIPLYSNAIQAVDNRIHARFTQNTVTGRLASSDPINLQNQPSSVRSVFVAESGKLLLEADWSNLELRLPAHFSGEPKFLEELGKTTGDLHIRTAELIFGRGYYSWSNAEQETRRRIAKTSNFLLTNSGSSKRLATELGCGKEESEATYKKFWEGYPVLAAWLKETKRQARANKGVSTMFGRWVALPQLLLWCGRTSCPVFGPNGFWCKECFIREETERQAISIKVQGTGSDLIKLALLRLRREHGYVPVATVHDSILMEEKEEKIEEVSKQVKTVMESLVTLRVPLIADIGIGRSWAEC